MKITRLVPAVVLAALTASLAACGGGASSSSSGTVNWWTWDDTQAAAYRQCVPAFEKANPGLKVTISQYNSNDYFTKLTTGFVGGTAPDGFMNSVQYLPSYAGQSQLEPLDDYIKKDKYDLKIFSEGVPLWQLNGKQYGLPMDWASTAVYYNKADIAAAGYIAKDLGTMTWNPKDGGTYEKIAAHLTVDTKGVRGDQPGFDKNHIKTYG
ncbi:extracellular solute-binding protein, partial [Kribbella sp.]|uniref:extracellular solute-binding protein n=1 Tax=Kribbella sp. TaxID=1871183 RepID=UPI002D25AECF